MPVRDTQTDTQTDRQADRQTRVKINKGPFRFAIGPTDRQTRLKIMALHVCNRAKNHSTIVKNLSRLTSRSFILKLLVDGADNIVIGKLFHASTILLQ